MPDLIFPPATPSVPDPTKPGIKTIHLLRPTAPNHTSPAPFGKSKALQTPSWIPAIMPDDPHTGIVTPDVVEKVVGKAVEVAAPQSAGVEVEKTRILRHLQQP